MIYDEMKLHCYYPKELFLGFNLKRLSGKFWNGMDRSIKAERKVYEIFSTAVKIVIDDIIENGVEFKFAEYKKMQSELVMEDLTGRMFNLMRKRGAFVDFDPFETNFHAYRIVFSMNKPWRNSGFSKPVHLDGKRTKRIAELAKQFKIRKGRIKTVKDYYGPVSELYPEYELKDIKLILGHGFRIFNRYVIRKGDVHIESMKNGYMMMQTGRIFLKGRQMLLYVTSRMKNKARKLYHKLKMNWDGYGWFSINKKKYESIKDDLEAGRKVDFGDVSIFKIYDEAVCVAADELQLYMMRVSGVDMERYFKRRVRLVTDKAELFEQYPNWTLRTLGMSRRKYTVLLGKNVSLKSIKEKNIKKRISEGISLYTPKNKSEKVFYKHAGYKKRGAELVQ